jgi:hypothetical protein
MDTSEVYILQFFRTSPGDLGINDLTHSDRGSLEITLKRALLSLHNNKTLDLAQRPHRARAITAEGHTVISTIEVIGSNDIRRIY